MIQLRQSRIRLVKKYSLRFVVLLSSRDRANDQGERREQHELVWAAYERQPSGGSPEHPSGRRKGLRQ